VSINGVLDTDFINGALDVAGINIFEDGATKIINFTTMSEELSRTYIFDI
jgi:hypothetical protein